MRLSRLEAGWNQHLPALLDSVSVAISEARRADSTHARVDAVRTDLDRLSTRVEIGLLELRHSAGKSEPANATSAIEVISISSLAAALSGNLKIQFLDSDASLPGHLSISTHHTAHSDLVAPPGTTVPFGQGRVQSIVVDRNFSIGIDQEALSAAVDHWLNLLAPGAKICIRRLQLIEFLASVSSGKHSLETLSAEYSAALPQFSPPWPSAQQIAAVMKERGFKNVRVITEKERPGQTVWASKTNLLRSPE